MEQAGFLSWDTVQLSKSNKPGLSVKALSPDKVPNLGFSHWEKIRELERHGLPTECHCLNMEMQKEGLAQRMLMHTSLRTFWYREALSHRSKDRSMGIPRCEAPKPLKPSCGGT